MSNIDTSLPRFGPNTAEEVRGNFVAAANEIDGLDARVATLEQDTTAPVFPSAAATMLSPPDPTGTTSTAYRMMGLGGSLTPGRSGRMMVTIDGQLQNSSNGQQTSAAVVVGTGTPPANGDLQTGNGQIVGSPARFEAPSNSAPFVPFSLTVLFPGISAGTSYWIDLAVRVTGGTGNVFDLNVTAIEII